MTNPRYLRRLKKAESYVEAVAGYVQAHPGLEWRDIADAFAQSMPGTHADDIQTALTLARKAGLVDTVQHGNNFLGRAWVTWHTADEAKHIRATKPRRAGGKPGSMVQENTIKPQNDKRWQQEGGDDQEANYRPFVHRILPAGSYGRLIVAAPRSVFELGAA